MPGLAADIPNPGDFITFTIADQPIFVMRGKDGVIRSFSNVCLHRMMPLLEGPAVAAARSSAPIMPGLTTPKARSSAQATWAGAIRFLTRSSSPSAGIAHRDLAGLDLCHA